MNTKEKIFLDEEEIPKEWYNVHRDGSACEFGGYALIV